jgi:NitT/TauT family transport system substrate-binding protein
MSGQIRFRRVSAALMLFLVAACAPGARAADTIIMGLVGAAPALQWPIHIGMAEGIFTAGDIKIDAVYTPSSSAIQQQVAAGSVDIGIGGMVDPLRAIEKGAPIAILRFEGAVPPYSLLAKPAIKRIEDLKGKTIILGGVADITRIYVERMLTPHGVMPGQFDMLYAGSTGDRFNALQSSAVDAAILGAPFDNRAEGLGFTNLGLVMDYVKDLPFTAYAVNRNWAASHGPVIQKFLASYQKCVDFFYSDQQREKSIDVVFALAKGDRADVAKSYDFFRKIHFFDQRAKLSTAQLEGVIDAFVKLGALEHPIALDTAIIRGVTPID